MKNIDRANLWFRILLIILLSILLFKDNNRVKEVFIKVNSDSVTYKIDTLKKFKDFSDNEISYQYDTTKYRILDSDFSKELDSIREAIQNQER